MTSAWDKNPNESGEVAYWKMQVRHWQAITPLVTLVTVLVLGQCQ